MFIEKTYELVDCFAQVVFSKLHDYEYKFRVNTYDKDAFDKKVI